MAFYQDEYTGEYHHHDARKTRHLHQLAICQLESIIVLSELPWQQWMEQKQPSTGECQDIAVNICAGKLHH